MCVANGLPKSAGTTQLTGTPSYSAMQRNEKGHTTLVQAVQCGFCHLLQRDVRRLHTLGCDDSISISVQLHLAHAPSPPRAPAGKLLPHHHFALSKRQVLLCSVGRIAFVPAFLISAYLGAPPAVIACLTLGLGLTNG